MNNRCLSRIRVAGTHTSDKFNIVIPPQDIGIHSDYIQRLADGDREAYAWVYKNYARKVYDYAVLITGNESISEDIVQEVFIKLWRHRGKLKGVENFNGYLYRLYRNYLLDLLKAQKKEKNARHKYYEFIRTSYIAEDTIFSAREKEREIYKSIKQLPPQQQLVFRLSRQCGWKRDKIAKELKISPNTVKGHLQKGLRFLKEKVY